MLYNSKACKIRVFAQGRDSIPLHHSCLRWWLWDWHFFCHVRNARIK